jgi:hypothetical protein
MYKMCQIKVSEYFLKALYSMEHLLEVPVIPDPNYNFEVYIRATRKCLEFHIYLANILYLGISRVY